MYHRLLVVLVAFCLFTHLILLELVVTYCSNAPEARVVFDEVVIAKVAVLRVNQERINFSICSCLQHCNLALQDKTDFSNLVSCLCDHVSGLETAGVQVYYDFIHKPAFAAFKENIEFLEEPSEQSVNQSCLVVWRQLLVKIKFFDNHVEVVGKCHFQICSDFLE